MKKFEYKIISLPNKGFFGDYLNWAELVDTLNELGNVGWEAVSAVGTNRNRGGTRDINVLLKREKA